jgi:rubrerythrin
MNVFKQFWSGLVEIQKDANASLVRDLEHELFELNDKLIDATSTSEVRRLLEEINKKKVQIAQLSKSNMQKDTKDLVQARMHDLMPLIAQTKEKLNRAISNNDNEARMSIEADLRTLNSEYHRLEDEMNKEYLNKEQTEDSESDYEMNVLDKDVNTSFAGKEPKSLLAEQDLEGSETTKDIKEYQVTITWQGDAQAKTKTMTIKANSSQDAIEAGKNKVMDEEGRGTFGAYNQIIRENAVETRKDMTKASTKVSEEFKVGDVLDPQGKTNMKGRVTIREIVGNTLKFTDSDGINYQGMSRSQVRELVNGGSWKKVSKQSAEESKKSMIKSIADTIVSNLEKSHSQDKLDDMIEDEKNGEAEYRDAANKTSDDAVAEQFNEMADDEDKHKRMLESMKKDQDSYEYRTVVVEKIDSKLEFHIAGKKYVVRDMSEAMDKIDSLLSKSMKKDDDKNKSLDEVSESINDAAKSIETKKAFSDYKHYINEVVRIDGEDGLWRVAAVSGDGIFVVENIKTRVRDRVREGDVTIVKSIETKKAITPTVQEVRAIVKEKISNVKDLSSFIELVFEELDKKGYHLDVAEEAKVKMVCIDMWTDAHKEQEIEETTKELNVFKVSWKDNFLGRYNATICENNGMYYAQVIETIENRPYLAQFYPTLQEAKAAIETCKKETVLKKSFASYWKSKVNKSMSISEKNILMAEVIERAEGDVNWMTNSRKYLKDKGASEAEVTEILDAVITKVKDY